MNKETSNKQGGRILVLYYSQTGVTRRLAESLSQMLGADIEPLCVEEPYGTDYDATIQRGLRELQSGTFPTLLPLGVSVQDYDTIFLGYPVWFGTYANPVASFVSQQGLVGKTVVPFCTFGSGGLESSTANLRQAMPEARVMDGYGVREVRIGKSEPELRDFLVASGYLPGEYHAPEAFSAQHPVSQQETAIYDTACGDYPFPLGTPLTVGQRNGKRGVDYRYEVEARDAEGNAFAQTVYVTVEPDGCTEFTRVVRL